MPPNWLRMPRTRLRPAHLLEQRILDVYNAVQNEGEWRVTISDDQINGWLASQLPKQFPYLLPHHASDPRVRIQNDKAHLACQYSNGRMSAVLSMAVEAFATDKPNVVGVRIVTARIGAVPGLMGTAVESDFLGCQTVPHPLTMAAKGWPSRGFDRDSRVPVEPTDDCLHRTDRTQ